MTNARESFVIQHLRRLARTRHADPSPDGQLLERFIGQRDEAAFAALVQRHGPMVLNLCRSVLRHEQDAEDAYQATFLVLAQKADSIRQPEAVGGWLYEVAYRVAVKARDDAARRRARERGKAPLGPADPTLDMTLRDLQRVLHEELRRLPEKYRVPLVLCYLEGRSHKAAAQQLGWTAASVRGRLERGRARLRDRLIRRGVTLGASLLVVESMATSPVTASLWQATVQTALTFAAGSADGIAANILALAESGVPSMTAAKAKWAVLLLFTLVLAGGTAALTDLLPTGSQPKTLPEAQTLAPQEPNKNKPPERTDALGDPLPPGAIARMGTLRLYHFGSLSRLVFSPDSKTIVSAGNFGDLRFWESATGKELRIINAYKEPISDVVFSPDGKLLVSSCNFDRTILVWETATGKELHRLGGDAEGIRALAFSRDGKLLASSGCDNSIRLWDTVDWKELRRLTGFIEQINSLAFTPAGKTLIGGSADNTLHVWDADKGRELRQFSLGSRVLDDFALSPDGKLLASRDRTSGIVGLWDVDKGKLLRELRVPFVWGVAFSPDGKTVATTGAMDHTLRLWDVATGKELRHTKGFTCSGKIAYAPNGKLLACSTAANAGKISLRDPTTTAEVLDLPGHRSTPHFVSFSEEGKMLRISDSEDVIGCWNVATGKLSSPLQPPPRSLLPSNVLTPTYISRNGKCAAAIGGDNHILLWHPATSKVIHDIAEPPAKWKRLAFSPTAAMLAATHQDGTVRLWDTTNGRQIGRFEDEKAANKSDFDFPIFSADGKTLVAVDRHDGTIHLWDVKTKQETRRLKAISPHIRSLVLSADGSMLVSLSGVPAVRPQRLRTICQLWNLKTGEELFQPPLEGDSLVFSPDSKMLAAARYDAIHLWEVATGRERHRFEGHRGTAYCLAFSTDSRLLASGGNDNTAIVWDVRSITEESPPPTDRQALWAALAGADAAHAYKAMCALIADRSNVSFLQQRLHAVAALDSARIARLIADLDSDTFAVRESATRELERLSDLAEPALRKAAAAKPSLEARRRIERLLQKMRGPVTNPDSLRALRSVEILEHIGTLEARQVLEKIAGGATETHLTQEAKRSLARLAARPAVRP